MSDITVPPDALRSFAGECRGTAGDITAISAGTISDGVAAGLSGADTAAALATAGTDIQAAFDAVAERHRAMADIANGTQDNYDVTEQEIVSGFRGMSHR